MQILLSKNWLFMTKKPVIQAQKPFPANVNPRSAISTFDLYRTPSLAQIEATCRIGHLLHKPVFGYQIAVFRENKPYHRTQNRRLVPYGDLRRDRR